MAEIRTFIAVPVDEAIVAKLTALQDELRRAHAEASWVRPEGMHLTLKFLGEVDEEEIPVVGDALAAVAAARAPFEARFAGVGAFPNLRRPRVIWVGTREGGAELTALAAGVENALAALDFPRETRPFSPHLTLGRVKGPVNLDALADMLPAHGDDVFGAMTVREAILFRSELSPRGAKYTALRRCPLGG